MCRHDFISHNFMLACFVMFYLFTFWNLTSKHIGWSRFSSFLLSGNLLLHSSRFPVFNTRQVITPSNLGTPICLILADWYILLWLGITIVSTVLVFLLHDEINSSRFPIFNTPQASSHSITSWYSHLFEPSRLICVALLRIWDSFTLWAQALNSTLPIFINQHGSIKTLT